MKFLIYSNSLTQYIFLNGNHLQLFFMCRLSTRNNNISQLFEWREKIGLSARENDNQTMSINIVLNYMS